MSRASSLSGLLPLWLLRSLQLGTAPRLTSLPSPLLSALVLLLALLAPASCLRSTPVERYKTAEFVVPHENGSLRLLAVNVESQNVYVGAVDYIYSLDKDLEQQLEVKTGPAMDNPKCARPVFSSKSCMYELSLTHNYIKVLLIDYVHNRLISCGTLAHGYCEKRLLTDISQRDEPVNDTPVVTNNRTASTVAFIAPGPSPNASEPQPNVLYVSVTFSLQVRDVPSLASRKLSDFSMAYEDEIKFTGTFFNFDNQQRRQFPVTYIYGFGSENFSYMLAVQKTSSGSENFQFHSVAIRVCQNDKDFYSYVEVPLVCKAGGVEYNLVQAAYVAKAGRELALDLGINTQTDVLYGVFSESKQPNSDMPTTNSALCVFPMDFVRNKFTLNIKRCFNGTGSDGGSHLGRTKCTRNTEFTITDEYCGSDSNQPLAGSIPIEGRSVLKLPASTPHVSALRVAVTHAYTVAFVGTKNGDVLKMSLESNLTGHVYETVSVVPGQEVKKDLSFDEDQSHLYVLSEKKVVKMKVANCSVHTTCTDCLAARDPYCGWCSMEFKCNKRSECQGSDIPKGWLAYNKDMCPSIGQLKPKQIPRDTHRLLSFDIRHLLEFHNTQQYRCVFSSLTDPGATPVSTSAERNKNNKNKFQCYTPTTDKLPAFAEGRDSVKMKLAVHVDDQELVHDTVTFYDCTVHSRCMACAISEFACTWCIQSHLCTDNSARHCRSDAHVAGINRTGSASNSNSGPGFCPRFESMDQNTEILVPAMARQEIQVRAYSLHPFQLNDLRCQFGINKVIKKPATAKKLTPDLDGGAYIVTCEEMEFSYIQTMSRMDVLFNITWGGADNPLDNTQGVSVVIYKCSAMAQTCGDCITLMSKFQCGWCHDNRCTTSSFCPVAYQNEFLEQGSICRNPRILSFTPKSGPVQGGTLVTIRGQNLGSKKDEVKVQIDMVKCEIVKFQAPNMTVCRTEEATARPNFENHVMIVVGKDYSVMNRSHDKFAFVEPRITGISPDVGPYAGGTSVTVLGEHMDAGSNVSVMIGQIYPCTQPKSLNTTALTCTTSEAPTSTSQDFGLTMNIDSAVLRPAGVVFRYVRNPNVTWVSRFKVLRSGGLQVNASGDNLRNVQKPEMLMWYQGKAYSGPCWFLAFPANNITCLSPLISGLDPVFDQPLELDFGFRMDEVSQLQRLGGQGKMTVYRDPILEPFKDGEKTHQQNTELLFLNGENLDAVREQDVKVHIGKVECVVTSVVSTVIMCKPPSTQPAPQIGSGFPQVLVEIGRNLTYKLGYLKYEQQQELSQAAIIGIAVGVAVLVLIMLVVCVCCIIKFRRNDDMMKKMKKDMDQLESRVANECKEAFAELQTDMSELASDLSGGGSIPFWDYRTYCMRVLFPGVTDHTVIRELELDYRHREDTERGLKMFFNLIRNKTFLLIFIRTLESNPDFFLKERVNVASLISVALQTQMEYATDILKTLLAELIEKTVENPKVHPKLLLRRNESVAEKMLTNWFTFLLYKFLKDCAGEPLFMLYGAIKQQVSKGPVDAVTSEARYSLSEDKLIRQQINFRSMLLQVMDVDVDRCPQPAHPVKVLDCDSISQVKEKILDAIFKSAPFGSRPPKEELDLVLFDHPPEWIVGEHKSQVPLKIFPNKDTKRLVLNDEDHTTKSEGDCRRLNTLSHYKVPDGAYVALHPKQTSIYNMSIMSEKSKFSDTSYYNRSPSLNRSVSPQNINLDVENCRVYHLVRHQDVESNNKEGERGGKMVSEIYLPRLLVTKGTLQTFVDDLFERIFSTTHRGTALPLAIKYMFDFLDDQAMHHNMSDEVVHTWKSNSLPLRFWVNVIKNPNFAFDIYKSNIVDACLTVIGQTFMDCCSTIEHKLTKDSPSGKLLYAKDIPKYKQWVARYYQDIKIMPAISDQDMTAMLAEESRSHQNEFNTNAALLELYKYVKKYYDDIVAALEDDEFAKKSKLTYKLDQVSAAMEGTTNC
ncbi:plexin-A2 [Aplysia californica]|uniref:Plexin-A2 n=1 Tax=Aplysia californica TaxID=6500 RepID=A0ABM1VWT6_APLCA|nr:plexin-A2 [Aplysia californica]